MIQKYLLATELIPEIEADQAAHITSPFSPKHVTHTHLCSLYSTDPRETSDHFVEANGDPNKQ